MQLINNGDAIPASSETSMSVESKEALSQKLSRAAILIKFTQDVCTPRKNLTKMLVKLSTKVNDLSPTKKWTNFSKMWLKKPTEMLVKSI